MRLADTYAIPVKDSVWTVPQGFDAAFDWRYDEDRAAMSHLYRMGVDMQWDSVARIDWTQEIDEENPQQLPEAMLPIAGMAEYEKMSAREKATVRRHHQAWQLSQFMHGEQGALICAAKIVTQVPDIDSKFYASTQTIDEARHVETYKRLLSKFGVTYPMTKPLWELIDQVLRDSRWDMTYLGMQVVIEGLALAAFAQVRDNAQNPLAQQVNAYVMQDESRHVAFGRLALRDYYPHLSEAERREREEFLVEACYLMRDRFDSAELWQNLGLNVEACAAHTYDSGYMAGFRSALFSRIVPIVKDIGLWSPRIVAAYDQMGVLGYAQADVQAMQDEDQEIARAFDARRQHIENVMARARQATAAAAE
ncbi:ferritin-like domain-containing protein [Zavarzinia sp. CC-PAN008]|uniref:ferritin-like domain-containing protein n=1 Tax=Zavarzinia sp. CC-PAN008 TaxID=3243332 RepID=UPI003F74635D